MCWAQRPSAQLVPQVGNNDIDDVNIIVFRQINQFDLSGNVITSSEYLPTLWVRPAPPALGDGRSWPCPLLLGVGVRIQDPPSRV